MQRAAAIGLSLLPLVFSLPTLSDPWGNSEESLNAAIWSLGAKNLLQLGPAASHRGALVSPHPGTRGDGIYAHHPPLAVWLAVLPVALGGWEGGCRLLALLCVTVSLLLLHRLLRLHFEPRAALVALAAAALSTYALRYGRLLTTLTLAAPLYLGLLAVVLEKRRPRWAAVLMAVLVLTSWDGVSGAAAIVGALFLARRRREGVQLGVVFILSLAFVVWHLLEASGGPDDLLWQFRWRASGDQVTWLQWLTTQAQNISEGLGPLALLALLATPFFLQQEHRLAFVLLLVPGVVMVLVFRQGASKHAFWAYLLLYPAAFAVAATVTRAPKLAPLLAVQLAVSLYFSVLRAREEHGQNQLGAVAKTLPRDTEIPVFARRSFHPYVSWYVHSKPITVRTLEELRAVKQPTLLVDTAHARELGLDFPEGAGWQVVPLAALTSRW